MKYIVFAEDARSAAELVSAAKDQGATDIVAVQFCDQEAAEVAAMGVSRAIVAKLAEGATKEAAAQLVIDEAKASGEAVVLVAATNRLINAAGKIAYALGTAAITDVRKISGAAEHMLYGGALIVADKPVGSFAVYVVSSAAFEPAAAEQATAPVETVEVAADPGVKVVGTKQKEAASVDLTTAKRLVCVGRGVADRDGFELCQQLAEKIGAEVGCTRPITETADPFLPRDLYIGSSGLNVKPELYLGVAVSGQTQHTMGMYESGKVVVIDKNKDAPFFQQCDYGIVGDYKEIVSALVAAL